MSDYLKLLHKKQTFGNKLKISCSHIFLMSNLIAVWRKIKTTQKMKNEEWLPIVDEQGNVIGKAPRSVCHSDNTLLHPVVHVHIFNSKKELFLQKRPQHKDVQPGKWDTAVGGHIDLDETLETAVKRETQEELGLTGLQFHFIKKYKWQSAIESELIHMFFAQHDGKITINKKELDDGRFWSFEEIKKKLNKNIFTPNFESEFQFLLTLKMENN